MGSTGALNMVMAHALAGQGPVRPAVLHLCGDSRGAAHLGPGWTILGGPHACTQTTVRTSLWFRDRQFLFTFSPYTKES